MPLILMLFSIGEAWRREARGSRISPLLPEDEEDSGERRPLTVGFWVQISNRKKLRSSIADEPQKKKKDY